MSGDESLTKEIMMSSKSWEQSEKEAYLSLDNFYEKARDCAIIVRREFEKGNVSHGEISRMSTKMSFRCRMIDICVPFSELYLHSMKLMDKHQHPCERTTYPTIRPAIVKVRRQTKQTKNTQK